MTLGPVAAVCNAPGGNSHLITAHDDNDSGFRYCQTFPHTGEVAVDGAASINNQIPLAKAMSVGMTL